MKKILIKVIFLTLSFYSISAKAQDHIYSQFFNAPGYLNPALTGQFQGDLRMNFIYRNQWTAISGDLSYLTASLDYQIPGFGGGLGLMINRSSEGTAFLKKNNIAGLYSYSVGLGGIVASFGLQGGITNRSIDYSKLVFSDQVDAQLGYLGLGSIAEPAENNNKYYFDVAAGANFVVGNLMVGGAMYHINKPDESFTGSPVKLPLRTVMHASYRLALDEWHDDNGSAIIPSVVVYRQSEYTSYSAGVQFKHRSINAGLWYRSNQAGGGDAMVFSVIFDILTNRNSTSKLRLGISHDATTSKINYSNTSGTSELSVGYETSFSGDGDYNRFEGRRCYDFY